ncbi:hypothetical protein EDB85DRAFT_1990829, partial [Lactarius pseudohatsudake]
MECQAFSALQFLRLGIIAVPFPVIVAHAAPNSTHSRRYFNPNRSGHHLDAFTEGIQPILGSTTASADDSCHAACKRS